MNYNEMNVYISVGSNIGPEQNITETLTRLMEYVKITGISTFYRNKPVLVENQDDYLNGVWQVRTSLTPLTLKENVLKNIELELHRVRTPDKNKSRTIDLDLLLFGGLIIKENGLTIPDPDIYNYPFVAFPLFELNHGLVLPDTRKPLAEILGALSMDGLKPEFPFTECLRKIITG